MFKTESLDVQAGLLWRDTLAWLTSHSLQILLGLAAGAAIVGAMLGLKWLGLRICRADPMHNHWRSIIGRVLDRTRLWFILALAARVVAGIGQAPEPWAGAVAVAFIIAAALQAALWIRELILGIIERRTGGVEDSSGLGSAIGIIRLLVSIAIFAIAIVVVLDNLGVNVTGLIAGLGIGGIAIGLAAQGIFKDLFAALAIIFDRPFRRGDAIKFEALSGHVEEIGLKSTRIRADSGEQIIVSNANLLEKELHNFAHLARRRVILNFGLIYQTPPEVCAEIEAIVRELVEGHEKAEFIRCGIRAFGQSSLDYELQLDVRSADYDEVFEVRAGLLIDILRTFNERGIRFAYPTQTALTAAPDGTLIMPYPDEPSEADVLER